MDAGTAFAIIGTVFGVAAPAAYAYASRSGGADYGKKLDEISNRLGVLERKIDSFISKQEQVDKSAQAEIVRLDEHMQELFKWRLAFIEKNGHAKHV